MKEIKDDTNRWRDIPCSWIGRINIVKMSLLPKAIYRFNAIPIKNLVAFFTEIEKSILKFVWNHREPEQPKQSWAGKTNLEVSHFQSWRFQIILQSYSNQNSSYWHKKKHIDQWNRIESPEINISMYNQFIFNKGSKNTQWGKDRFFK